jgi:hypothetical protein
MVLKAMESAQNLAASVEENIGIRLALADELPQPDFIGCLICSAELKRLAFF